MGMLLNAYFSIIQNILPIVELIHKKALVIQCFFTIKIYSAAQQNYYNLFIAINFEDETTSSIVAVIT
jgi:hypothetical protein